MTAKRTAPAAERLTGVDKSVSAQLCLYRETNVRHVEELGITPAWAAAAAVAGLPVGRWVARACDDQVLLEAAIHAEEEKRLEVLRATRRRLAPRPTARRRS